MVRLHFQALSARARPSTRLCWDGEGGSDVWSPRQPRLLPVEEWNARGLTSATWLAWDYARWRWSVGWLSFRRVPKANFPELCLGTVPGGRWHLEGPAGWREGISERHGLCGQQEHFAAVELELEVDVGGAQAAAAGQRLLQAEAVAGSRGPSGRAGSALRWFTTIILYAAFLGLVRAGAASLPGLPDGLFHHLHTAWSWALIWASASSNSWVQS
jgi:hypothetical protein